jgi:dipeptidyl aminopeptidase/acylaminoacyl peptidase
MKAWIAVAALAAALLSAAAAYAGPARNGQIVFASNRAGDGRDLYLVNRDGTGERRLTFTGLVARAPQWSPSGDRIAFALRGADGNVDIYTVRADGSNVTRLTTDPGRDDYPSWTSDGRIVWQHDLDSSFACPCSAWIMNADGSGKQQLETSGDAFSPAASPRGSRLAFARGVGGTSALFTQLLNGAAQRQITQPAPGGDFQPRWAPNGNDIAFLRDTNGADNDLYVVHSDGTGLRQLTNTPSRPEFSVSWAPDGSEILFFAQDPDGLHLYAIRPDGSGETRLSTIPTAPLTEDFAGAARDASLWHEISDPGGSIGIQNGRLVASIAHDAVPGGQYDQVDEHWGSQCSLAGDYDYQVDWSLLTWPAHSGTYAALQAFFAGQGISRQSTPYDPPYDEQITSWTSYSFAAVHSDATSGSFRLVRSGGAQYAYARTGGSDWQLILATPADTGANVYGMGLWAPGNTWAHVDVSVAFDNFRLNSGALTCPTWWSDSWPDFGPAAG